MSNKKSMASRASKTMRNKRASKISKSLAGSVLAKAKYNPAPKQPQKTSQAKEKRGK